MFDGPEELLPHQSLEAEMSVLGSMLLSSHATNEVVQILKEEEFYRPNHQIIFRHMRELVVAHKAVDYLTLRESLLATNQLGDIGGDSYLVELAEGVPSPVNAVHYAQIVKDRATLRSLDQAGREIIAISRDSRIPTTKERLDRAESTILAVADQSVTRTLVSATTIAEEYFREIDEVIETGKPKAGLKTNFYDLDNVTTGHYPGDLIIIGGRPAMGKTSLGLDAAMGAGRILQQQGQRGAIAIFSLEMTSIQLIRRMVAMLSGVPMSVIRRDAPITDRQYEDMAQACERITELPLFIDESPDINALEMRAKCRRLQREHGLALVLVDYLQLMRGTRKTENRVQEVSEIARGLKGMAKDLKVPVFALCQLSRAVENREDKRPQLADIRESGSIEAEADMVMLLYRDSYYKKQPGEREVEDPEEVVEAEVIVAKNRNGPVRTVKLGFQPAYARYRNLARASFDDSPTD